MLGQVGKTTVAVSQGDKDNGKFSSIAAQDTTLRGGVGEDIYGPFEAGFTVKQDRIIQALGCDDPSDGYLDGGIDTYTAEQKVAKACNVEIPRWVNGNYISLLDQCGGHTKEYHNHERLICLYDDTAKGHSTKVGEVLDGTAIYGKWEDTDVLPLLDACSAHYGKTPESSTSTDVDDVYHYHVQDAPPFVVGCFGPNDDGSLVTVQQCRDFYTGCDGTLESFETTDGKVAYDMWCPCYDQQGSNSGLNIVELEIFKSTSTSPATGSPATGSPGEEGATTTATESTSASPAADTPAAATTTAASGTTKKPNVIFFMPVALPTENLLEDTDGLLRPPTPSTSDRSRR